jgi:vacuolar-type H+-ATPase subunit H
MTPGLKQRKHYPEEDEQIASAFDGISSLPSVSGASVGLPESFVAHEEESNQAISKEMRTAIDLPGVKIVHAANIERDQIISAANLAADRMREEAHVNAAKKREETLATAMAVAQKERKAIIEKAKKDGLAFKSKKTASVPKVAGAVFSKVFSDMF